MRAATKVCISVFPSPDSNQCTVGLVLDGNYDTPAIVLLPDQKCAVPFVRHILSCYAKGCTKAEIIEEADRIENILVNDWADTRRGIRGLISILWRRVTS